MEIPDTEAAGRVDRALQALTRTGRGFVRRIVRDDGPDEYWLYTDTTYAARVQIGPEHVLVIRVHPRP